MLHRTFNARIAPVVALLAFGFTVHTTTAQQRPDAKLHFATAVSVADPFDPANAKDAPGGTLKVRRGSRVRVQLTGTPDPGWHTYPITLPVGHKQDEVSTVKFGPVKGLKPAGAIIESPPEAVVHQDQDGPKTLLQYEKPFTWTQEFDVAADAPSGRLEMPIGIDTLVCDVKGCIPFRQQLKAVLEVTGPAVAEAPTSEPNIPEPKNVVDPGPPVAKANAGGAKKLISEPYIGLIAASAEDYGAELDKLAKQIVKDPAGEADKGDAANNDLAAFILAGIFWGAISLITPCVFPMIPITVSFFLKQSEKENHRPVVMASVYSLTIVVVLTLAAAFLLQLFRTISINPFLNYGLGALFVFFALSLFGMYEIELPSSLARFTSAREGQGGLVGTMFMALTFTIISFACIAPFLGGFGGTAAAARPMWHNLLGGLAFSATFAAPFFVLALFPALLKAMPKSGSWLNAVKVVMGFLELAAAFKFFRGAELLQTSGEVTLFSYDFVLGIWIALSILCGLYLIGLFRLPHDTPSDNIGVPRLLFSAAFLCLAVYLMPALFKVDSEGTPQRPGGAVYAWIDAFLLPESQRGHDDRSLIADVNYAVAKSREHLQKTGTPRRIFVDFTGVICSNCRFNENNVFKRSEVQKAFAQYLNVEMFTDNVPLELFAPALRAELTKDKSRTTEYSDLNGAFQQRVFGEITLPYYALLEPQADGRVLVVDVYGNGKVNDEADFIRFVTGVRAAERMQFAAAK
jgi:thiol:disulfide interchange protein DsbD